MLGRRCGEKSVFYSLVWVSYFVVYKFSDIPSSSSTFIYIPSERAVAGFK